MGKLLAQFWTILVFIQAQGFICLLLFTHPLVFGGKKSNQSVVTHRNTFLSQMFSQSSCSHISLLWLQEGKLFKSEKDWKKGAFSLLIFSNTICFQELICLHAWTRRCPYMAIKWCVRKSWALKKNSCGIFYTWLFSPYTFAFPLADVAQYFMKTTAQKSTCFSSRCDWKPIIPPVTEGNGKFPPLSHFLTLCGMWKDKQDCSV